MRTIAAVCATVSLTLCLVDSAVACSNKTLKGTYMMSVNGWVSNGSELVPDAYAAFLSFNGAGGIVLKKTSVSQATGAWATAVTTGQYTINADCTGTANYPTAQFRYFIEPDGDSVTFIKIGNSTDGGETYTDTPDRLTARATRVSRSQLPVPN